MMQAHWRSVAFGFGFLVLGCAEIAQAAGWSGVVDFGAKWCGPCRQMAPIVDKLRQEGLPIQAVDVDERPETASKHGVNSYPTFVLFVDGKEIDRVSGAMSEADLRRLLDRVPLSRVTGNGGLPGVELGEAEAIPAAERTAVPRPGKQPLQQARVAQAEPESRIKKLWPFGEKEAPTSTVRGNDDLVSLGDSQGFSVPAGGNNSFGQAMVGSPLAASIRIRVTIADHVNLGSGTVVSSREGNTLILTCGHIFRGYGKDCKIEVDLFENGKPQTIVARLEKYDLESDLGLIAISTPAPVPMVKVASAKHAPTVGMQVASVGCSGGDDPTRDQVRVTSVDKYEGPNNIECTGIPVQGRSGGGLFDVDGRLIGVCIAADPKEQRGLYSGLLAIHDLLNRCELAHLYDDPVPGTAIAAATEQTSPEPFLRSEGTLASSEVPVSPPVVPAVPSGLAAHIAQPNSMAVDSSGAEAVIILKDKNHPEQPHRVVIIHEVSPKFMSYLSGELDPAATGIGALTSSPAVEVAPSVVRTPLPMLSRSLRSAGSVEPLPYVQRLAKSELAPTSLSKPRARAYVRSAESR